MIFNDYTDFSHPLLIKSGTNFNSSTIEHKIYKIFNFVRNNIIYENSKFVQKASETLVFGFGNNTSKNILLYSLLKINKIECSLESIFIKDNFNCIISKNDSITEWYFVKLNISNKTIILDPTLDSSIRRGLNIRYTGDNTNYFPLDFKINDKPIFSTSIKKNSLNYSNII
ncbi:hypothetical protein SAMN02745163_03965 [Clostridium cavendishii DSM 21758]|uniref:Transglutaminase-like superfamily protein n=1 Tax=Clostridium cavendishii DSM 21758 TaxID=1121302 RepID=A0A1M6T6K2_9CLOT|nr:hypothetical protein [Clostridium cavendishii]SHK52526.1 hypothetical protein SAMN02745163_03965 [Clostridium cavendishii DSM 21758]